MTSRQDDLALARGLGEAASEIALRYVDRVVESEMKDDGSPVSEVDLAIESELIDLLRSERPDDAILSEERGEIGSGERRWLLDPLDGTSMFLDRVGGWGTLITLQEGGESVVAVITRPLESRCWWAVCGQGAFCCGLSRNAMEERPVTLSNAAGLSEARITAWGDPSSPEIAALSNLTGWIEPSVDSFTRMAEGELDAIVSLGGLVWDHAPCVLILEEAGGVFRDPRGGKRLDLLGGVYSNPHLSGALGAVLGWY